MSNYYNEKKKKDWLKTKIIAFNPKIQDISGIYIIYRNGEDKKVSYVGQSVHILTRLAEHLDGWQKIDKSLQKWGLYTPDNKNGYKISYFYCDKKDLDAKEREYIKIMLDKGYISYNATTGGQDGEKRKMGEWKAPKGYQDGLKQGYKNCQKYVIEMFGKYLNYSQKQLNKIGEKKLKEWENFLKGGK